MSEGCCAAQPEATICLTPPLGCRGAADVRSGVVIARGRKDKVSVLCTSLGGSPCLGM